MPHYFILLGIGIGIWSGYLIPKWKIIAEMFVSTQSRILGIPSTDIIIAYCIGLLLISISLGQILNGWWGWVILLDGLIPALLMQIDRDEITREGIVDVEMDI